ncbi:hypothetical protein ABH937_003291 [Kitasatospora sp. GAS1066B]
MQRSAATRGNPGPTGSNPTGLEPAGADAFAPGTGRHCRGPHHHRAGAGRGRGVRLLRTTKGPYRSGPRSCGRRADRQPHSAHRHLDLDLDAVRPEVDRAGDQRGPLRDRQRRRPGAAAIGVEQQMVGRRQGREVGRGLGAVPSHQDRTKRQRHPEDRAPEERERRQPDRRRSLLAIHRGRVGLPKHCLPSRCLSSGGPPPVRWRGGGVRPPLQPQHLPYDRRHHLHRHHPGSLPIRSSRTASARAETVIDSADANRPGPKHCASTST